MEKARNTDTDYILNYLEKDIEKCLYMYADISKYGVDNENMEVWYDTDCLGIHMVVMKYHNNFQLYSNRGFDNIEKVINLVKEKKPLGISGRKEIIVALYEKIKEKYGVEFGVVLRGKPIDLNRVKKKLEKCNVKINLAKEEEAPEIARLLCMDEELGSVYTEESMANELAERIRTKMGRSYIIREGDNIVAHNATYAECDKFVVVSGFMVHPDFRNTEYAYWLDLKSSLEFQSEGKERYFLALNDKIIHWHKITKTPIVAEYGKLSLLNKI